MRHNLSIYLVIVLFLAVCIIGCGGNYMKNEEEWLVRKCSQCHAREDLNMLFAKAKAMSKDEFENALQGMAHEGIDFSESDKSGASLIIEKLRQKR